VDVVADPQAGIRHLKRSELFAFGFRRSGLFVYRPECPGCQACVAVRIPVAKFHPSRTQKRCAARNQDLHIERCEPAYSDEIFALYQRYLASRHPGGGMDNPTPESFREFLCTPGVECEFFLFRKDRKLVAVAVTDLLDDGLSANYTFYDPKQSHRSLGTFAILTQVAAAYRRGLPYVYLGYWIARSEKMRYKSRFRPLELYHEGRWRIWSREASEPPIDAC